MDQTIVWINTVTPQKLLVVFIDMFDKTNPVGDEYHTINDVYKNEKR